MNKPAKAPRTLTTTEKNSDIPEAVKNCINSIPNPIKKESRKVKTIFFVTVECRNFNPINPPAGINKAASATVCMMDLMLKFTLNKNGCAFHIPYFNSISLAEKRKSKGKRLIAKRESIYKNKKADNADSGLELFFAESQALISPCPEINHKKIPIKEPMAFASTSFREAVRMAKKI